MRTSFDCALLIKSWLLWHLNAIWKLMPLKILMNSRQTHIRVRTYVYIWECLYWIECWYIRRYIGVLVYLLALVCVCLSESMLKAQWRGKKRKWSGNWNVYAKRMLLTGFLKGFCVDVCYDYALYAHQYTYLQAHTCTHAQFVYRPWLCLTEVFTCKHTQTNPNSRTYTYIPANIYMYMNM